MDHMDKEGSDAGLLQELSGRIETLEKDVGALVGQLAQEERIRAAEDRKGLSAVKRALWRRDALTWALLLAILVMIWRAMYGV